MSERIKATDIVDQMRAAFATGIAEVIVGTPAHVALQAADHLCAVWLAELAGFEVAVPALPKVDGAAITEDWRRGLSADEIRRKHGCSKRTAYNYHPMRAPQKVVHQIP